MQLRNIVELNISQLKHGENIRDVTQPKIDGMMRKLVINGHIDPVVPFIVLPQDEDGLYPTHDGNTRLAALNKLEYTGNVKAVEISHEQAQNKQFLLELQTALGTSNNRLTEIESAKGVVQWIAEVEKSLVAKGLTAAKARSTAIQSAVDQESFDVAIADVRNYVAFFQLDDLLKINTVKGLISNIRAAVLLEKAHAKLVKTYTEFGYADTLKDFYYACLDSSLARKDGGITKLDIDNTFDAIASKFKTEQLKAEIKNEDVLTAVEAGEISPEAIERLREQAEIEGVEFEEALQLAVEHADNSNEAVSEVDLEVGLRESKKTKNSKESLSEQTDEELEAAIFGTALDLLLTVGGDSNDLISAIKQGLKNYEGITLSDYDRVAKERLYRASATLSTAINKTESSLVSRKKKAEKAEQALLSAEKKAVDLAAMLENLQTLEAEAATTVETEETDVFSDDEVDSDEMDTVTVEADDLPVETEESDVFAGVAF